MKVSRGRCGDDILCGRCAEDEFDEYRCCLNDEVKSYVEVESESADSDDMQLPNGTEIKQLFKAMNGINKGMWVAVRRQVPRKSEPSTDSEPTPSEVAVPSDNDSFHSLEN